MDILEKLKTMTAKDVILAMVAGLEKKYVKVDMDTYGKIKNGVCFGCAATNALCEMGMQPEEAIRVIFKSDETFYFEMAVNDLRKGYLRNYNRSIRDYMPHHANLKIPEDKIATFLPFLGNRTYEKNLQHYKDFANSL